MTRLARDEITGLGAAMAGGKARLATTPRRARDFYPTPADCTRALLIAEGPAMLDHGRTVWEPCGHGGAIARELGPAGFAVLAGDVAPDPANQVAEQDLLRVREAWAPIVVTNPPFALAGRMIEHLLGTLRIDYLALLLKTTFWCTSSEDRGRLGLWRRFPPQRRWDLTWRPNFLIEPDGTPIVRLDPDTGLPLKGGSTMNVSWFVWDADHVGDRQWNLLDRSGPVGGTDLFGESK